jgi:hypothetical protein
MKAVILSFLISLLIVDKDTNEPLTGVSVRSLATNETYYSNLDGVVFLPDSCCDYQIEYISYKDTIISSEIPIIKMREE